MNAEQGAQSKEVCRLPECDKPARRPRSWCSMHHSRLRRTGTTDLVPRFPPVEERIWHKIALAESGCWLWQDSLNNDGYGHIFINGTWVMAHRYAWELLRSPIPEGMQIDHLCRVRHCVNPEHLEPVTSRINTLRSDSPSALNARKTHCAAGHPFDDENTAYRVNSKTGNTHRSCRACSRERARSRSTESEVA